MPVSSSRARLPEAPARPSDQRRHSANFAFGVLDGSFFGLAIGLASYVTVLPLFVHGLTDSAILIGSISAIRLGGWQLPQVLTVRRVSRLTRYKPMVLAVTSLERLPFFGLAAAALLLPTLGSRAVLALTMALLVVHGLAGGFTATAWQAMIAKVIPTRRRGRFFGMQSAGSNVLASFGALASGAILARASGPRDFALCFFLAGVALAVSWTFLARIQELDGEPARADMSRRETWSDLGRIVGNDRQFRWFVAARALTQLPLMTVAFLTVYGVDRFHMTAAHAGALTALLTAGQALGSLAAGSVGDRFGHRWAMAFGVAVATLAAGVAAGAPVLAWLAPAFALAGAGAAALWTSPLALSLTYGDERLKPAYIALSNTLVAPATLIAPLLGGLLADGLGYRAMFSAGSAGGIATLAVLVLLVREPTEPAPGRALESRRAG